MDIARSHILRKLFSKWRGKKSANSGIYDIGFIIINYPHFYLYFPHWNRMLMRRATYSGTPATPLLQPPLFGPAKSLSISCIETPLIRPPRNTANGQILRSPCAYFLCNFTPHYGHKLGDGLNIANHWHNDSVWAGFHCFEEFLSVFGSSCKLVQAAFSACSVAFVGEISKINVLFILYLWL